jgi:dihydroorotase
MKVLIKNARLAATETPEPQPVDILIANGLVKQINPNISEPEANIIDAQGKIVVPGLIDVHVHFREPGQTHKEDIRSGSHAAAAGGFTTVVAEPNTTPPIDTPSRIRRLLAAARKTSIIRFYTKAAITVGTKGKRLAHIHELKTAGAQAVSDDGHPVPTETIMLHALEKAAQCNILVTPHCEESPQYWHITRNRKHRATQTFLRHHAQYTGEPKYNSEARFIERDITLAEKAGARIHISHVSLAESVEIIAAAKERGAMVTAETTPHHFILTADDADRIGTNAKVNPPLRSKDDVKAIKQGLRDGTIDIIASDHAPHSPDEKNRPWNDAPFGVIGLETTLGLVLTHLVRPGILTLKQTIDKMTIAPAEIYGLNTHGIGSLTPGSPADLVIIDPDHEWKVNSSEFHSKGRNCPFDGLTLQGRAVLTMVNGRIVARNGKVV